jgi:hypothetical protein
MQFSLQTPICLISLCVASPFNFARLSSLQMTSQSVDIFSMLNKAQTEYNQQQNSVAAFFRQASTNGNQISHNNNNNAPARSMPMPINSMPMHSLSSLEQIERQIRTSPPSNRK